MNKEDMSNNGRENETFEDVEKKIKNAAQNTPIPPGLKPASIEEKLNTVKKERKKKKRTMHRIYIGAAAAACLCLLVGATAGGIYLTGKFGTSLFREKQAEAEGTGENHATGIKQAEDYGQILWYIQENLKGSSGIIQNFLGNKSADYSTASESAVSGGISSSQSYSDTNVREEGVAEGDKVKTDGDNLYVVNNNTVSIIGLDSGEMEVESQIKPEESSTVYDVYVENGKLVVVYEKTEYEDKENPYQGKSKIFTNAVIYDIRNCEEPKEIYEFTQSGGYYTMRVKDGYVYLISTFYPEVPAAGSDISVYIPEADGTPIDAKNIYMPQDKKADRYTVVSSFTLSDTVSKKDSKAVLGGSGICYVSKENIYFTETCNDSAESEYQQTSIQKLSYADGMIEAVAQTKIDGTLNDSFSIDEYDGSLRIAATVMPAYENHNIMPILLPKISTETETEERTSENALYILNEKLEITGKITGLAEGEQIYSARFIGNTGYFVTFRQIDPLFSVDLSDPSDPKVIGELKIPGFSEYLHPYGEGRLLGIGMDVDEEGITTEGVKLSMFNISDPSDVKEEAKYILEDMYSTEAAYDYRFVFVDVEKNLFGFTAFGNETKYFIFTYSEESGFSEVFSRTLSGYDSARGLYVGDCFYLISGNTVEAYKMDGFEKIGDIVL